MLLDLIKQAVERIDWDYAILSRRRYEGRRITLAPEYRWQERPFAYEIYHQLRCIWDKRGLKRECLVQAEVLKRYQGIRKLGKMPDILFHLPNRGHANLGVLEIKLGSNTRKSLKADFEKLRNFQRVLGYRFLVEVVIGTERELELAKRRLKFLQKQFVGTTIIVVLLSLGSRRAEVTRMN